MDRICRTNAILMLALVAGTGVAYAQQPPAPVPVPAISMPAQLKVQRGRLATLDVQAGGKKLTYRSLGAGIDTFREQVDDPAVFRLRVLGYDDGVYYIVVAAGGDMPALASCEIVVGAGVPVPPVPPGPDNPVPPVEPDPEPDVGVVNKLGMIQWARDVAVAQPWTKPQRKAYCTSLANAFLAAYRDASTFTPAADPNKTQAYINQAKATVRARLGAKHDALKPAILEPMSAKLSELNKSGQLPDVTANAQVFRELAEGWREASKL